MSQIPVPFGQAIVSKSGFDRDEFDAANLLHDTARSKPNGSPGYHVFGASIGKDQYETDCGFEWTVWLNEDQEIEDIEVLHLGTAEIHGSLIGFEMPTSKEETK